MRSIAIIPARGGSKRIPGKNIKLFHGKPIITYAIDAALESELFDSIVVSTDSAEIASVARRAGAEVPFMRSEQAANDTATMAEALIDTLSMLAEAGRDYDRVCCLFATAPFVTSELIRQGARQMDQHDCESVVVVQRNTHPILRSLQTNSDGQLQMVWQEHLETRSQDLGPTCHDAAQMYWVQSKALVEQSTFFTRKTQPLYIHSLDAHDIDTQDDWLIAERLWAFRRGESAAA